MALPFVVPNISAPLAIVFIDPVSGLPLAPTFAGSVGSAVSFAAAAGANANVTPTDFGPTVSRLDVTAAAGAANISGIAAGSDGQLLIVSNQDGTNNVTLQHDNAGSLAANRLSANADVVLTPRRSVLLCYYSTSSWRIIV